MNTPNAAMGAAVPPALEEFVLTSAPASEMIAKITARTVVGRIDVPTKQVNLFLVYGIVHDHKEMTTDTGASILFRGTFEALRASDNARYFAPQLMLPEGAAESLLASLKAQDEGQAVEFCYEISVKPNKNAMGYGYNHKALIQARTADPLSAVRAIVSELLKSE